MKCKNCKWWDKHHKAYILGTTGGDFEVERQVCLKAHGFNGGGEDMSNMPMVTIDGEGYFSALYTLPNHCCNSFESEV